MRWERWVRPWDRITGLLASARGDLGMLVRTVGGDGPSPVLRSSRPSEASGVRPRPQTSEPVSAATTHHGERSLVRVIAGGVDAALRQASGPAVITVRHAGGTTRVAAARGQSMLDAAEHAGLAMPSSCRAGGCGACRVRLVSGTVALPATHCLSAGELAAGDVLTCVAAAEGAVELEVVS